MADERKPGRSACWMAALRRRPWSRATRRLASSSRPRCTVCHILGTAPVGSDVAPLFPALAKGPGVPLTQRLGSSTPHARDPLESGDEAEAHRRRQRHLAACAPTMARRSRRVLHPLRTTPSPPRPKPRTTPPGLGSSIHDEVPWGTPRATTSRHRGAAPRAQADAPPERLGEPKRGPAGVIRRGPHLPSRTLPSSRDRPVGFQATSGVAVGIREIAGIASPERVLRRLEDRSRRRPGLGEHGVDLVASSACCRRGDPPKPLPAADWPPSSASALAPTARHDAAELEEHDLGMVVAAAPAEAS